jgi:hypothetical protein
MLKLGCAIALALLSASCATAPRDSAQEGARLTHELIVASGGAALDAPAGFHETGAMDINGATATYETWGDFHALRYATTRTRAGHSASAGFDGNVAWATGPDGVVQTDASAEGLSSARLSAYLTIAAYLYPDRFPARFEYKGRQISDGKSYDVVTATPADSAPIDFWLDTETHRLQRLSGIDGGVPFVGVVERYQVVDGVWVPFAIRQTEGDRVITLSLTSYEFTVVPATRFAVPAHE